MQDGVNCRVLVPFSGRSLDKCLPHPWTLSKNSQAQLCWTPLIIYKPYFFHSTSYHVDDGPVAVCSCEMERGVIPHVGGVDPGTTADQHLHDLGVATLGGPMQGGELMVIPRKKMRMSEKAQQQL